MYDDICLLFYFLNYDLNARKHSICGTVLLCLVVEKPMCDYCMYEDVFVCVIKKDYDRERLKTMRTTMCEQRMRIQCVMNYLFYSMHLKKAVEREVFALQLNNN